MSRGWGMRPSVRPAALLLLAQPGSSPPSGGEPAGEVLWYMGGGILALLLLGFLLSRRTRQRPTATAFGESDGRQPRADDVDETPEQIL